MHHCHPPCSQPSHSITHQIQWLPCGDPFHSQKITRRSFLFIMNTNKNKSTIGFSLEWKLISQVIYCTHVKLFAFTNDRTWTCAGHTTKKRWQVVPPRQKFQMKITQLRSSKASLVSDIELCLEVCSTAIQKHGLDHKRPRDNEAIICVRLKKNFPLIGMISLGNLLKCHHLLMADFKGMNVFCWSSISWLADFFLIQKKS